MNITIKEQKKNPLMSRKEITAIINFEGSTPKREEVQKELAKKVKIDEKLLIVKTIYTTFGHPSAKVTAYAYETEEIMKKSERKNLIEKHLGHKPKKTEGEE